MKTYRALLLVLFFLGAGVARVEAAMSEVHTFIVNSVPLGPEPENTPSLTDSQTVTSDIDSIGSISVNLNLSTTYNGDLFVTLTHGSGFSVLLNRTGRPGEFGFGYGDDGFNITLNDSASNGDVHLYQEVLTTALSANEPLTGTWQPDGRTTDPAFVVPGDPRTAMLSSFQGLDPDGTWTLYVEDFATPDPSSLVSWGLEISAVPEPVNVALGVFGTLFVAIGAMRRRWRRRGEPDAQRR